MFHLMLNGLNFNKSKINLEYAVILIGQNKMWPINTWYRQSIVGYVFVCCCFGVVLFKYYDKHMN